MPLAKLKTTSFSTPAGRRDGAVTTDLDGKAGAPSPARLLQQRLEYQAAALGMPDLQRWPVGRSVALIVAGSMALWIAILEASATMVHAIA